MLLAAVHEARAAPPSGDSCSGRNEQWVLSAIAKGEEANFELKCSVAHAGSRQNDDCRRLSGICVTQLLARTPKPEMEKIPHFRIVGATIDDDVDLTNADLSGRDISIEKSALGKIALDNAEVGQLSLEGSKIRGEANAEHLMTDRKLDLSHTTFAETLNLEGAHIGGALDMSGARFEKGLAAVRIQVDGPLNLEAA
jgi:hypothetical protein